MRSQGGLSLRSDCLSGANRSTLGQHCFALPRHTEKFLSNVFILGGEQPSHALESARLSEERLGRGYSRIQSARPHAADGRLSTISGSGLSSPNTQGRGITMVGNILEMLTSGAGKDLIGPAAKLLGESETGVQSAVTSLLPVLLGGMTQKASTTGGAADLFKMVTGANVDTGLLGNIAGALGGAGSSALTSVGSSLLSGLFGGDKSSMLGNALASVAGIKPSSATSLLGMATPLVFGAIKKLVSSQNLDAGGLANVLLGQKGNLAKANIDPRLSSVLGTGWMD
ncbi:MAG: DUF937 domain-containing protein, partial [Burkholderiales bacterium]|nr:DUF937 domain-containing protein [Burkholderiales bacterium]